MEAKNLIVTKRVVGRNNQRWVDLKKDISISLAQLREFVTMVTQKKTSARGFKSTCEQIESFIGDAKRCFEVVDRKVFGDDGVVDTAEQVEYDEARDLANRNHLDKLVRATKSLKKYLEYFQSLIVKDSVARAAVSIAKYKNELVRIIDKAKHYNTELAADMKTYLNSEAFELAIVAPDSTVAIAETDLTGTKAEKKKFLDELRARAQEDESKDEADPDDEVVPEREENFIVEDDGIAHAIPDDEAEIGNPAVAGNNLAEETFVANDDDDDESSSSSGDESGDSDDDAVSSEGGALFEGNLAKHNKKILSDVSKSAFMKNGRALRNNGRLQEYAKIIRHNKDLKVKDYRTNSKSHQQDGDDPDGAAEERDYGSELSSSDDDEEEKDQINAIMQQIEAERKKTSSNGAVKEPRDSAQTHTASTSTKRQRDDAPNTNGASTESQQHKKIKVKTKPRDPDVDSDPYKNVKVKIEPQESPVLMD